MFLFLSYLGQIEERLDIWQMYTYLKKKRMLIMYAISYMRYSKIKPI